MLEETIQMTKRLTLADKVRLLQHLSSAIKEDLETEAYKHMPWQDFIDATYGSMADEPVDAMGYPLGYFEETYGSMADDPIERNQPPSPDVRDEIE